MDFDRRSFLTIMAGFVVDPERLLWRRGEKLISIPKVLPSLYHYGCRDGWRAQTMFGSSQWYGIADEAYRQKLHRDEQAMIVADLFFEKIPRDTPDGFHRYKQFGLA